MKQILAVLAIAAVLAGCGEQKVDAEKLNRANALVNTGQYEEGIAQLEGLYANSPDDIALKQSLISAHMKYANFNMYNDDLAPRVKYPQALKHYRAVLKLDPNHQDAKSGADQIVEIYEMMGRPVPEV
jgi:tetratricopeptide (TPR) repeat protein